MLHERSILSEIRKWYFDQQIILLNGARQVGKTSILMKIKDELEKQTHTVAYFNLEDIDILNNLNEHPYNLLGFLPKPHTTNEKQFVLLDEIQYLDNPSNFLKLIYDTYKEKIKMIATDSSSLELKAKLQDSLVGRKITFLVTPLNFYEFLEFKQADIKNFFTNKTLPEPIINNFIKLLNEYLLFGGMPAVVLENDIAKKKSILRSYVNDYINKDIRAIGKIDDINSFNKLILLLSNQIGNLINISEITNSINLNRKEVIKYLDLLKYTYVFYTVHPYYTNTRSQITKMPKGYFFDLGIRNQLLNNYIELNKRTDSGALFENFIYISLLQQPTDNKIFFYRTSVGGEIDFIIQNGLQLMPVEVKYKKLKKPLLNRTIKHFLSKTQQTNQQTKSYCVNLNLNNEQVVPNHIDFIRFLNTKLFD